MNIISTLIKWPGGKTREIKNIEHLIPKFDRYIEPFFGGGAMFFFLKPKKAAINDISSDLMDFYTMAKQQNRDLHRYLLSYYSLISSLISACDKHYNSMLSLYMLLKYKKITNSELIGHLLTVIKALENELKIDKNESIVLDANALRTQLILNSADKMQRTLKNELKKPYNNKDLKENLIAGFASGLYMYFRDIYNDIHSGKLNKSKEFKTANFYFIREYCYGSMFRYNSKGEFNIPYGGMTYNRKDLKAKIDYIFCSTTEKLLKGTDIYCLDFEKFLSEVEPTENDFMFLDPPYDTEFSDYEGVNFTQDDQRRLAETLKKTKAKFILIIKNTDFIYSLYKGNFNILCYDKTYTYNLRSRNDRSAEHLIITNSLS